jgi:hypothetical protein
MFSSLMGTFNFSAPNHQVYATSNRTVSTGRLIAFWTSYFDDLSTLPSSTLSWEGHLHAGMAMSLLTTEIMYEVVLVSSTDPDLVPSPTDEEDLVSRPVWATSLSCSHDFLNGTFPSDEAIIEAMNSFGKPWDDMHFCSYSLLSLK